MFMVNNTQRGKAPNGLVNITSFWRLLNYLQNETMFLKFHFFVKILENFRKKLKIAQKYFVSFHSTVNMK